jgi:hypothetical protein
LLGLVCNLQKQSGAKRRFDPQAIKKGAKLIFYSCRQVYEDIKPKKRMAARSAAILFLGFAFVLTQSTAAIIA